MATASSVQPVREHLRTLNTSGTIAPVPSPAALRRVELSGRTGTGSDPCAAVQTKFELGPGEERSLLFILGEAETLEAARELIGRFREPGSADAVLEMPPLPGWFAGRERIGRFLAFRVFRRPGDFAMVPTAANGQPAFAAYLRGHDGVHRAHAVQVLTVSAPGIARVVSFNQPELLAMFGMAQTLPSGTSAAGQRR